MPLPTVASRAARAILIAASVAIAVPAALAQSTVPGTGGTTNGSATESDGGRGATVQRESVDAFRLEPETASALMAMNEMLARSCSAGRERACALDKSLQQISDTLLIARRACARGNRRGCAAAERGAERIAAMYERFQRATGVPE